MPTSKAIHMFLVDDEGMSGAWGWDIARNRDCHKPILRFEGERKGKKFIRVIPSITSKDIEVVLKDNT